MEVVEKIMKREDFKIEICANSAESCIAAQKGGADRVELCASIPEGGTTPSYGEIMVAREAITIGLNVIIRPRGGDFLYSPREIDAMVKDIEICRRAGADGLVFGVLKADGTVDMRAMSVLMEAAGNIPVTFHRAFDHAAEPFKALEDIISLGCARILTSGQQPTAEKGIPLIAGLVKRSAGRIIIMPGCGVREGNIAEIASKTGAREFHFSAREQVASGMVFRNRAVCMGAECDEFVRDVTMPERVAATISELM